jgi:hypothetical protein
MSLWTPGGEHQVPREPTPAPGADTGDHDYDDTGVEGLPGFDELTPEQQQQAMAMARELAETRERLAQVPAAEVVANHVMGLYELAAIHLSVDPPSLGDARLAIDAMVALVDGLSGRLGEHEPVLIEARTQLQMAFVEVKRAVDEAAGA